jgi:hypothetical protein
LLPQAGVKRERNGSGMPNHDLSRWQEEREEALAEALKPAVVKGWCPDCRQEYEIHSATHNATHYCTSRQPAQ